MVTEPVPLPEFVTDVALVMAPVLDKLIVPVELAAKFTEVGPAIWPVMLMAPVLFVVRFKAPVVATPILMLMLP
jgi:hypothetical protein